MGILSPSDQKILSAVWVKKASSPAGATPPFSTAVMLVYDPFVFLPLFLHFFISRNSFIKLFSYSRCNFDAPVGYSRNTKKCPFWLPRHAEWLLSYIRQSLTHKQGRNRIKAQPPPPVKVVESWSRPSSSYQHAAALPRSQPRTTTTTTTTRTVQYREPVRYETTLPVRPPHSRKHSSSKHHSVADREPSYTSSSSKKSSSKAAPPRSNDRFYEYRREEPVTSRGRAVVSSYDSGGRTTGGAPRAYSQDRGGSGGVYSAFGSSRRSSRDAGSRGSYEYSSSRDEPKYGSRRLSYVGSTYSDTKGEHRGWGIFRRH